ncbi:uncharacterized protein M421DRAFT_191579 [Didymella exigua CBS 183.55]|uniref:Uncharacterized protein n=1 Tax=Didymella exigua CBS 183.55 TaxID=1150837 RepID=A0A6A5S1N5_9PLEO|nr:uncharacterized protein M421DRAFT_191579 [Didymella exigua CBS 183.55]KAF1933198.1 hypothetical protein M421DRAFT_191579 [Didymella exigua CBS 183.55]
MRFLTLEECSDSELHCVYHDAERTITVLHPRTACSLQVYAPEEDSHAPFLTFHTRRPNSIHSWWLQLLDIAGSQLLGLAAGAERDVGEDANRAQAERLQVDRDVLRWHLMNVRSIIPAREVLDEEEHLQTIQPLPSPWSWPRNTFYREARRGYANHLTEALIEELVTHGLLLANETGIRWKHLDQYVLVKIEEPVFNRANRSRFERLDTRAFRRARIGRPGINGEPNEVDERPGPPIVEAGSPLVSPGEKKVRLCSKKAYVCIDGDQAVVKEEDIEDNEGKTVGKARKLRCGR